MPENKKITRLLSILLVLNFLLIILCLGKIKYSYMKVKTYNTIATATTKDDYTKRHNSEIIGSITIANHSFLLTQTSNNTFYLNHDYEQKEDKFGAIFVDYRCSLLEDTNCFIYGHSSSKYDLPFNLLFNYENPEFKEENKLITINYRGFLLTYEIVGVTNNYDNLDKYLYIQTCDETAQGDIILVAKKL